MNKLRIAAIILVLSAGAIGSYFIVKNSAPSAASDSPESSSVSKLSQKLLKEAPLKWIEQNKDSLNLSDDSVVLRNQNGENDDSLSQERVNLTQIVASSMFERMKQLDQGEENPFESDAFNPDDPVLQKLLADAMANLRSPNLILGPEVKEENLKISNDNSHEAKSKYLETTGKIILDNSNEFYNNPIKVLENLADSFDPSGVNQLADAYLKIYNGFLNTPAPSNWFELHKNYASFLKNAEAVYRGIADFQNDPIKAQLLIQTLPEITRIELDLKQEFYRKSLNLDS